MSVDEAYVRSVRGNVESLVDVRRGHGKRDFLDEASVSLKVAVRLTELGFNANDFAADKGSATKPELAARRRAR